MKKLEGGWALVVCALGWSLAGVFMKYVAINSFAMAGFRSIFAFITIAVLSKSLPVFYVKGDKKATLFLWASAFNYATTMILFCIGNKLTYSANVVILQYTNPAWIILLGPVLLGEKNTKIDYCAIGGIVVGMLLFFADSIFGEPTGEFADTAVLGNILSLLSGVSFAFTTIFQRKNENHQRDAFMLSQIIVALFGLPFIFIMDNGIPDYRSLLFLVLLGVFQMGIPNITYAIGIKKVRALSASLITMIEPLMNPVWVLIFVHEIPNWTCILGGLIILGCILVREIVNQKKSA